MKNYYLYTEMPTNWLNTYDHTTQSMQLYLCDVAEAYRQFTETSETMGDESKCYKTKSVQQTDIRM